MVGMLTCSCAVGGKAGVSQAWAGPSPAGPRAARGRGVSAKRVPTTPCTSCGVRRKRRRRRVECGEGGGRRVGRRGPGGRGIPTISRFLHLVSLLQGSAGSLSSAASRTCSRSPGSLPLPASCRPSDAELLERNAGRQGWGFVGFCFCFPLSAYSLFHWNEHQVFLWGDVSFSPWVRTGRATVKILFASGQGWACGPGRPAGCLSCGLRLEPSGNRRNKTQLELMCAWWHQGPGPASVHPQSSGAFPLLTWFSRVAVGSAATPGPFHKCVPA